MTVPSVARRWLRGALAQVPAADRAIRTLRRTTVLRALDAEVASLRAALATERARMAASPSVEPFLTWMPPGHFYSPVPDMGDIEGRIDDLCSAERLPAGVDLREREQVELFGELAALARETPLGSEPGRHGRYGIDNPNYGIGDASMLHAMLRKLRPRHYLEVGSGFTTALAIDVNEQHLETSMQVTAIEPFPDLLRRVTRPDDTVEVVSAPVQSVPLERFTALGRDDVLLIDSSHVLKTGSDVQFLYGRVLPVLAEGVYVHIHDIFWPFEYLPHWIEEGRAWNEAYLLQAFLTQNRAFEMVLWNHFLAVRHRDVVAAALPQMLENPGGALWMRRRAS